MEGIFLQILAVKNQQITAKSVILHPTIILVKKHNLIFYY